MGERTGAEAARRGIGGLCEEDDGLGLDFDEGEGGVGDNDEASMGVALGEGIVAMEEGERT